MEIYRIKVTLRSVKPPIWRRLLVPADMTLEQLHQVLQIAMGWDNYHLHEFSIGPERFGVPDPEDRDTINEKKVRLAGVLGGVGAKALYSYDFGDGWEHTIAVEKVMAPEPGQAYPVCVAGKRRCPPEDCGGASGYFDLLDAIKDPKHEEHESLLEWVGGVIDPEDFSIDHVNARLAPMQRRRAKAQGS